MNLKGICKICGKLAEYNEKIPHIDSLEYDCGEQKEVKWFLTAEQISEVATSKIFEDWCKEVDDGDSRETSSLYAFLLNHADLVFKILEEVGKK